MQAEVGSFKRFIANISEAETTHTPCQPEEVGQWAGMYGIGPGQI